ATPPSPSAKQVLLGELTCEATKATSSGGTAATEVPTGLATGCRMTTSRVVIRVLERAGRWPRQDQVTTRRTGMRKTGVLVHVYSRAQRLTLRPDGARLGRPPHPTELE